MKLPSKLEIIFLLGSDVFSCCLHLHSQKYIAKTMSITLAVYSVGLGSYKNANQSELSSKQFASRYRQLKAFNNSKSYSISFGVAEKKTNLSLKLQISRWSFIQKHFKKCTRYFKQRYKVYPLHPYNIDGKKSIRFENIQSFTNCSNARLSSKRYKTSDAYN